MAPLKPPGKDSAVHKRSLRSFPLCEGHCWELERQDPGLQGLHILEAGKQHSR